jgi:hypothetical protein
MEIHTYRGMTVSYMVEPTDTGFWHARGCTDLKIGETLCTVFIRTAGNWFTSEEAARNGLFEHADKWLDALLAEPERPG